MMLGSYYKCIRRKEYYRVEARHPKDREIFKTKFIEIETTFHF